MSEDTKELQKRPAEVPELVIKGKPDTVAAEQDARGEAVAKLLANAYAKASELTLTEAETKALRAKFDDDQVRGGAKGEDKLLYICHIHLSDRLNDVLGMGQWALVKRSQRAEQAKTKDNLPLMRIYFEGVMLIRGAFVAEAIGVGQYHPNNPKEDYGSALESAMSDCLTRCCKRLGIGSQVWDKGYCETWLATCGGTRRPVNMPIAKPEAKPDAEPEPPAKPPADAKIATGTLTAAGSKRTSRGSMRYGIKVGDDWYNTFNDDIGKQAVLLKDTEVDVTYHVTTGKDGAKYNDILNLQPAGLPVRATDDLPFDK